MSSATTCPTCALQAAEAKLKLAVEALRRIPILGLNEMREAAHSALRAINAGEETGLPGMAAKAAEHPEVAATDDAGTNRTQPSPALSPDLVERAAEAAWRAVSLPIGELKLKWKAKDPLDMENWRTVARAVLALVKPPESLSRTIAVIFSRLRAGEDQASVERDYGLDAGDLATAGLTCQQIVRDSDKLRSENHDLYEEIHDRAKERDEAMEDLVDEVRVKEERTRERDDARLKVAALEDKLKKGSDLCARHIVLHQDALAEVRNREALTVVEFERKIEARNRELNTLRTLLESHVSDWRTFGPDSALQRAADDVERLLHPEKPHTERRGD